MCLLSPARPARILLVEGARSYRRIPEARRLGHDERAAGDLGEFLADLELFGAEVAGTRRCVLRLTTSDGRPGRPVEFLEGV
jgi:hypothetical protein